MRKSISSQIKTTLISVLVVGLSWSTPQRVPFSDFPHITHDTQFTGTSPVLIAYIDSSGDRRLVFTPDSTALVYVSSDVIKTENWATNQICTLTSTDSRAKIAMRNWYYHSSATKSIFCNLETNTEISII